MSVQRVYTLSVTQAKATVINAESTWSAVDRVNRHGQRVYDTRGPC